MHGAPLPTALELIACARVPMYLLTLHTVVCCLFRAMVAVVSGAQGTEGSASDATDASGKNNMMTLTISKVFGGCDKLTKDNYDVWLAGLISALTGLTALSTFYKQLEKTLRWIKTSAHMTLEQVTAHIGQHVLSLMEADRDRTKGAFLNFNTQLFHVLNTTISDTMTNIKKTIAGSNYFEDGLKVLLFFADEVGPGDKTVRTGTPLFVE